ncbi:MAG: DUF429 domain-containing protein [Thermoproteota archaeon]|jgi:predicted nuclease with RNAse H fold|nr:DUF429 domain-containing protein [Thermoproteota archaeon]
MKKVAGIDLAGSEKRYSGVCIMDESLNSRTLLLRKDEEIISYMMKENPVVIAIDAPLSLPLGRKSLEEPAHIHLRECDKALLRMGIKLFPASLGPMRKLTNRGIKLRRIFEEKGFEVIEVLPGATQDLLGIPRKHQNIKALAKGLKELGIKGIEENMSGDELDAITCAYTAVLYLKGDCYSVGNEEEGLIIIPKIFI